MSSTILFKSPSPLPQLLLLLSATTGLVDAVSVLGLGKVFTANMTGNVVFLGFAAAGTPGFSAPPYVIALAAFMAGAALGGLVRKRHLDSPLRHWLMRAAGIEAVLFVIAAAIAFCFPVDAAAANWPMFAIIALTATAMGFRNATVRQLKVPDLTTTVLTLTITGLAADARLAGGEGAKISVRLGAVASIFAGAVIGAVLLTAFGLVPPLLLASTTIFGGTIVCARHPFAAQPYRP